MKNKSNYLNTPGRKSGFTLIELLTVIAIIAILAAILIPTISKVRHQANAATSTSNLRQMGQAINLVALDSNPQAAIAGKGRFPAGWGTYGSEGKWADFRWHDVIAEKLGLAQLVTRKYEWTVPGNQTIFQDPGYDVQFDTTSFETQKITPSYSYNGPGIGNAKIHPNIPYENRQRLPVLPLQIEYPSKLVVISESGGQNDSEYRGDLLAFPGWYPDNLPTRYNGGGHYLFADGHVEWVKKEVMLEDWEENFHTNGVNWR